MKQYVHNLSASRVAVAGITILVITVFLYFYLHSRTHYEGKIIEYTSELGGSVIELEVWKVHPISGAEVIDSVGLPPLLDPGYYIHENMIYTVHRAILLSTPPIYGVDIRSHRISSDTVAFLDEKTIAYFPGTEKVRLKFENSKAELEGDSLLFKIDLETLTAYDTVKIDRRHSAVLQEN